MYLDTGEGVTWTQEQELPGHRSRSYQYRGAAVTWIEEQELP
jgi:hypothetical protein